MYICFLQLVIDSLLHHMTDPEIATTGIACLFYMSKPDSNAHVAPTKTVMRRIVRVVITALETHLYDSNVSSIESLCNASTSATFTCIHVHSV